MKRGFRVDDPTWSRRRGVHVGTIATVIAALVTPLGVQVPSAHALGSSATYGVGVTRCTFVDRTRNVLNYATSPPTVLTRQRTLVTEVRYPTLSTSSGDHAVTNAPPAQLAEGFPMIVFAHGYDVTPDIYSALLDAWTQRGFVVASPIFPDENSTEVARQHVNTEGDIFNEPADLAFVTRQLIGASTTLTASCPLVQGLVRSTDLAIAGHSDGAVAVGLLDYSTGRDPQGVAYSKLRQGLSIRATLIFSGSVDGAAPYVADPNRPPLLLIQSARDQCNAPDEGLELYRAVAQGDKWFLELLHAHHLPPFDGEDRAAFDVVTMTTSTFLQLTLNGSGNAATLHAAGNARPLVGRLTRGGVGPSIAPFLKPPPCGFH